MARRPRLAKPILTEMKKIFKSLDWKWLAVFAPLTVAGFVSSGAKPLWIVSTVLGAVYLGWQVYDGAGR